MMSSQLQIGKIINNQYITKKHLNSGSFGAVYLGHELDSKTRVAIKIEKISPDDEISTQREVHPCHTY